LSSILSNNSVDIRDYAQVEKTINEIKPEIVFHLAAQALVPKSFYSPRETFDVNVMGTVNVLEALRQSNNLQSIVIITTDKVYRNREWCWPYRETDRLGGYDPYSASKAAVELVVDSYRKSFFKDQGVKVSTARAGNVIGGGDWSRDRLVPDLIRAWRSNQPIHIRMPQAVRPWQHVLEPLYGYMRLAEEVCSTTLEVDSLNFGPLGNDAWEVGDFVKYVSNALDMKPYLVRYSGDNQIHETQRLTLDVSKSAFLLGTNPQWSTKYAVDLTVKWYVAHYQGEDSCSLCEKNIELYERHI
jgi:CDP-glucose 4,6-dehydratase